MTGSLPHCEVTEPFIGISSSADGNRKQGVRLSVCINHLFPSDDGGYSVQGRILVIVIGLQVSESAVQHELDGVLAGRNDVFVKDRPECRHCKPHACLGQLVVVLGRRPVKERILIIYRNLGYCPGNKRVGVRCHLDGK